MTDEATHVEDEGLLAWATEQAELDLVEQAFSLQETEARPESRRPARALSAAEIAEALGLPVPTPQQQAVIEAPLRPAIELVLMMKPFDFNRAGIAACVAASTDRALRSITAS